jgi:methyl-accepting chemotaxis protein
MKLTNKLQLSFALPTAFLVILGGISIWGFHRINQQVATIYDDRIVPLTQLKNISDDYAINIIDAVNKAHAGIFTTNEALNNIVTAQKTIETNWREYQNTKLTTEEKKLSTEVTAFLVPANEKIDNLIIALRQNDKSALAKYDGELYSVVDSVTEKIKELIDLQLKVAQQEREYAEQIYSLILWTFIPFLTLAVILVIGPIRIFIEKALIAALKDTINIMASTSSEIATAAEEQERLAERQASSVSRTTSTMNELQVSSQQSSQQAETAAMGAQQVLNLSSQGNQAVQESLQGMSELKDKVTDIAHSITTLSDQINQINTYQQLVGDIADQTNMLALNAAVEAVRAGEHGKGFSVVATEIRKLADQSKESADKINQLVSDIKSAINTTVMATESGTKTVEKGVNTAQKTATTFRSVAQSVEEVVINLQQISLNVKQQAVAVNDVVQEMGNLNQAAHQTASGVAQTKVGTQKLSETALNLQSMV